MDERLHQLYVWGTSTLSTSAIVGALMGLLPVLGIIVPVVWYTIQITESDTYKKFRQGRRQKKIAKLQAAIESLKNSGPSR